MNIKGLMHLSSNSNPVCFLLFGVFHCLMVAVVCFLLLSCIVCLLVGVVRYLVALPIGSHCLFFVTSLYCLFLVI